MSYTDDIAAAQAIVADAGTSVTFSRTGGTFTPSTSRVSGGATTASGSAVRVKGTDRLRFASQTTKLVNPIVVLVAASGLGAFQPQPGDRMVFAGTTYTVKDTNVVAPDGTAILYNVVASE